MTNERQGAIIMSYVSYISFPCTVKKIRIVDEKKNNPIGVPFWLIGDDVIPQGLKLVTLPTDKIVFIDDPIGIERLRNETFVDCFDNPYVYSLYFGTNEGDKECDEAIFNTFDSNLTKNEKNEIVNQMNTIKENNKRILFHKFLSTYLKAGEFVEMCKFDMVGDNCHFGPPDYEHTIYVDDILDISVSMGNYLGEKVIIIKK